MQAAAKTTYLLKKVGDKKWHRRIMAGRVVKEDLFKRSDERPRMEGPSSQTTGRKEKEAHYYVTDVTCLIVRARLKRGDKKWHQTSSPE